MKASGWAMLIRLIIIVVLVGAVSWWAVLAWGAEHHWLLAAWQYAPYWGLLPPVILTFALSWTQGWLWRLLSLTSLVVLLVPVMDFVWAQGDTGHGHIRLMTYNIKAYLNTREPGGLDRVAWEIAAHDPDIVVMQDAGEAGADDVPMSDQAKRLVGARQTYAFGQYVVASRLPLRDCGQGFISYRNRPHTYVRCVVTAHGKDIDLITAHLVSPREGLNAMREMFWDGRGVWARNVAARMTQAQALAHVVSRRERPLILAGDLNAPERSMVVQALTEAGLRDAFSVAGAGYGFTHGHSLRPGLSINRIDHILVSDELGVAHCEVGTKEASDHRPVIADLWVHRD